jgi:hypothetical protein
MEKDLANAKALAAKLENEAAELRKLKISPKTVDGAATNSEADVSMEVPEEHEEPEPRERGCDAVERRIEKVMTDLRQQGLVDVNDDKAYEVKKVCTRLVRQMLKLIWNRRRYRSTCTLPT